MMTRRTSGYGHYKEFMRRLMMPLYASVGFNGKVGDAADLAKLRSEMVEVVCKMDYPDCTERSKQLFKTLESQKSTRVVFPGKHFFYSHFTL